MAYTINLLNPVPRKHNGKSADTSKKLNVPSPKSDSKQASEHGSFDEQKLNSLASSICKIDPDAFPDVIVIANTVPHKDKGVVAAKLGAAIARIPGKSVFLVDADTTSPSLHTQFHYGSLPGLTEYLEGESDLSPLILETNVDRLQILPAGQKNATQASLLASDKMTRFVSELKAKCPGLVLMINIDATILYNNKFPALEHADGVVYSIDEEIIDQTQQKDLMSLTNSKKLLGVIRKSTQQAETPVAPEPRKKATPAPRKPNKIPETSSLVTLFQPDSIEAEQFNKLTADMIKSDVLMRKQVFMITSPSPGDGKSYVSSNLAVSLAANTEKNVLIIDCDLRAPSIHTYFNCRNDLGLSDYLSGKCTLSELIEATDIENLSILPAGPFKPNALQLLSSDKMTRLVKGLKKKFKDLIIILDAAPPSLMSEGCVVSKLADSVALVANHNRTNKDAMKKLAGMFDRERLYGVIYNNYNIKRTPYQLYKKYNIFGKAA